jgi:acetolactate synthase regulatory subunit
MSKTMQLELDCAEGSLQRLIGLIERRGFHIDGMVMDRAGEARSMRIQLRARDDTRHVEVLGRQIDRLYGVRRRADPVREVAPCVA